MGNSGENSNGSKRQTMLDCRNADGYCDPPTREAIAKCTHRAVGTRWSTWCDYRSIVTGICMRESIIENEARAKGMKKVRKQRKREQITGPTFIGDDGDA